MWPQTHDRKGYSWSHPDPSEHFSSQEEKSIRVLEEWLSMFVGARGSTGCKGRTVTGLEMCHLDFLSRLAIQLQMVWFADSL